MKKLLILCLALVFLAGCKGGVPEAEGTGFVQFDGRVLNVSGKPVAGAEVEVNGQRMKTSVDGHFRIRAQKSNRYLVNVRGSEYALWSQVFLHPVSNGRVTLVRASRHVIDPKKDVVVTDVRRPEDCPGPLSKPKDAPKAGCGPGIEVRIPANSLVDANNQPPKGDVVISLATYDIQAPQQMPGDRLVGGPAGNRPIGVMTSFGAGFIEARSGGKSYNLKKGATAVVRIPVYPGKIISGLEIPKTIPLLNYDDKSGLWRQSGVALLEAGFYTAQVNYFSPINADQIGSPWACVKVNVGGEVVADDNPANMRLEIRVGASSTPLAADTIFSVVVPDFLGANFGPYVIYALLVGQYVTITPYNDATNAQVGSPVQVLVSAAQNPQLPNPPVPVYGACADQIFVNFSWSP
jgi:hypothetical protein